MNLLEHYIKKVISVKDVTQEWEKYMQEEEDPNFIERIVIWTQWNF